MDSGKKNGLWSTVKRQFIEDDVFWENEKAANRFAAKVMLLLAGALVLSWVLNVCGVFAVSAEVLGPIVIYGTLELVIPAAVCLYLHGEKRWLKYLLILALTVAQARIDSVLSFNVVMAMLIPVVLSSRYFSRRFTEQIAIFSTLLFAISAFCGAWFDMAEYNLMYQAANRALYTKNIMLQFFLPKWLIFCLISVVCIGVADWGRQSVLKQAKISGENSRVETELDMARKIQHRALPPVSALPQQEPPLFDLAASMEPAKQVGGDFYDFFYQDSTHLVLMIADVSGKGVPAALFMMAAKLLLDNSMADGRSPGQALEEVNHQLCEKNLENMFVTVWLGVLDLETGELVSASAGHEYPLLCRAGGDFEILKDRHGFVLGGMDGMKYRETKLQLAPGDILFVYTDGIPEANDPQGAQFGMERMIQSLNRAKEKTMQETARQITEDVREFAGEAPQFDDITMLALRLERTAAPKGISTDAGEDSLQPVSDYVQRTLEAAGVTAKTVNRALVIVDEVYSNIIKYSGATAAEVTCTAAAGTAVLEFADNGTPYDPLQAEEPDITAALEEREIGGLGIFMTRKLAAETAYRYENERNYFTVKLNC